MMEAICYSETLVKIYQNIRYHILEDIAFRGCYVCLKLTEIKFCVYRKNQFHRHLYSSFGYETCGRTHRGVLLVMSSFNSLRVEKV
jgi:hypothetical protein